jgi:hypothetical protein
MPGVIVGIVGLVMIVLFTSSIISFWLLQTLVFSWLVFCILFLVATSKVGFKHTLYLLFLLFLLIGSGWSVRSFINSSVLTILFTVGFILCFFLFLDWGTSRKWRK